MALHTGEKVYISTHFYASTHTHRWKKRIWSSVWFCFCFFYQTGVSDWTRIDWAMTRGVSRLNGDGAESLGRPALPDLRFEQTFRQSLRKEALKQHKLTVSKSDGSVVDPPVTAYVVAKVVFKDILLGPFVQGVLLSSFLIVTRPYLLYCRRAGLNFARRITATVRSWVVAVGSVETIWRRSYFVD